MHCGTCLSCDEFGGIFLFACLIFGVVEIGDVGIVGNVKVVGFMK